MNTPLSPRPVGPLSAWPWARAMALAVLLLTVVGCQHVKRKTNHDLSPEEMLRADELDPATRDKLMAQQTLGEVYRLLRSGRPVSAKALLDRVRDQPHYQEDIARLDLEIERRLNRPTVMHQRGLSEDYMSGEVDERMILPRSYAQTRVISPSSDPYQLPVGPMEALLNRKVTMRLDEADVAMIVGELNRQDGLNIIADNALDSEALLNISVKDVALREVLSYISRNMGIAFHLGDNVVWVTKAPDVGGETGPEMPTRLFHLHRGQIPEGYVGSAGGGGGGFTASSGGGGGGSNEEELVKALNGYLDSIRTTQPENAYYAIYRDRGIIVVRNSVENMRMIERIIAAFDNVPPQILVEARFVTINQDDLRQLGTSINEIAYKDFNYSSVLPAFSTAVGGAPTLALSGIIDNVSYDAAIQAIDKSGTSRTLSAPRITVLNNREAELRRGEKRYFFREFELESTGGDTPVAQVVPSGDAEELELGITLKVRPTIGHDRKTIMLAIEADITEFIEFVELAEDISLPVTDENNVKTIVAVNSGETLVMGGQLAMTDNDSLSQTPGIGNVPVLGWLFKKKDKSVQPQHLLIFVTATLIDPDGYLNVVEDSEPRAISP